MNKDKMIEKANTICDLITDEDGNIDIVEPLKLTAAIISSILRMVPAEDARDILSLFAKGFNHSNEDIEGCRLYTEDDIKPLKDTIDSLKFALNRRTE